MEAIKKVVNQGLEALAKSGGQQLEAGLKAGYGATLQASSVKALADAVVDFQSSSFNLIKELREQSTNTANEIENVAEDANVRWFVIGEQGGLNGTRRNAYRADGGHGPGG